MQKTILAILAAIFSAGPILAYQDQTRYQKVDGPPLTEEEKDIVKSRLVLENLDLLRDFEKFRFYDLFAAENGSGADTQVNRQIRRRISPELEWAGLTQDQREILRRRYQSFRKLPPEQQQDLWNRYELLQRMNRRERMRVLQNFDAFQRLTPEQRLRLEKNYGRFKLLPPARQQELREIYRKFLQMNPQRRAQLLENFRQWQQLTPEQRERLRRRNGRNNFF